MRHALFALSLAVLTGACTRRATSLAVSDYAPFRVEAVSVDSLFTGSFEGRMRQLGEGVEILIDSGMIRYQGSSAYPGRREVNTVAVALAQGDPAGHWMVTTRSRAAHFRRLLAPGDQLATDSLAFRVSRRGLPLSDYWLVVELETVATDIPPTAEGRGVTFFHSDRNVFASIGGRR